MKINLKKKLICPGFEAEKQLRTLTMLWKIKTWVKTGISWDWLLLKAAIWLYVGGLQSLLPVIKLLKSGGRFFVDSAKKKKDSWSSEQKWCFRVHRFTELFSSPPHGAREWGLPSGSGQLWLGTGACSRDNWCHALPSAVSLLTLPQETLPWKMWSSKQNYHCMSFSSSFKKGLHKGVENRYNAHVETKGIYVL